MSAPWAVPPITSTLPSPFRSVSVPCAFAPDLRGVPTYVPPFFNTIVTLPDGGDGMTAFGAAFDAASIGGGLEAVFATGALDAMEFTTAGVVDMDAAAVCGAAPGTTALGTER